MTYAGYWGPEAIFWSTSNAPARNTPVSVKVSPGGTLATLYTDQTKATTVPNPINTDSRGNLAFYADPGTYILEVSGGQDPLTIVVSGHPLDPDAPHNHAQADVTGLTTALSGKSDTGHTHTIANVTSLQTTLDAKVAEGDLFLNVKDYGAVGNGGTDDTVAIQAALDAVPAGGGTVYFPTGTYLVSIANGDNVNKLALRLTKTGVTLRGAGRGSTTIKLANSVGDYTAMVSDNTALGTTDLSGLTIRDLTFDQNSTNNVVSNINQFTGQPRFVLRWQVGQRLVVENCRFTNTDNINTIYANGSAVQHVSVRHCVFDNVGANSPKHDHSAVYTHGSKVDITGNTFVGGGISATTAIETHGGIQTVRGNRIENFFCFLNVTGVSASSIGGSVVGNVGRGLGTGIVIWSRVYTNNTSGYGMEDFVIQGNTLEIDIDQWAAVPSYRCGISLDVGSSLPVHNVFIRGNIIRYKAFTTVPTASDNVSAGIQWYRVTGATGTASAGTSTTITTTTNLIGSMVGGIVKITSGTGSGQERTIASNTIGTNSVITVTSAWSVNPDNTSVYQLVSGSDVNVDFSDNIIERPPAAGFYINPNSGPSKRFSFTRNWIINPGEGNSPNFGANFKSAMLLVGSYEDVKVSRNQIVDDRVTHFIGGGLDTSLATSVVNGEQKDNNIRVADGTLISPFSAATGAAWSVGFPAAAKLFTATRYYTAPFASRATLAMVDGTAFAHPFWMGVDGAIDRMGVTVLTAVAATAVRLGIYRDNGKGSPGALLLAPGSTIDSTTTGAKELTVSQALSAGLYWLVAVAQGGAPSLQGGNGQLEPCGGGALSGAVSNAYTGLIGTGVSGALPSTFPTVSNYQVTSPVVALRAA